MSKQNFEPTRFKDLNDLKDFKDLMDFIDITTL